MDEQLRAHIATGLSGGMAANEMGLRRNQVVGRASRLGLSFKSMPGKKRKPTGGQRSTSWKPGVTISQKFPYKEAPAVAPDNQVESINLTIWQLSDSPIFTECRWPTNDDIHNLLYCGLPVKHEGCSWCGMHLKMSKQPHH